MTTRLEAPRLTVSMAPFFPVNVSCQLITAFIVIHVLYLLGGKRENEMWSDFLVLNL